MALDKFAEIAQGGIGGDASRLYDPMPIPHARVLCALDENAPPCPQPEQRPYDAASLKEALVVERERFRPFLRNLTPPLANTHRRFPLMSFTCDGTPVTLPHYGGPLGVGRKIYETVFSFETERDTSYVLHFDGVDYTAAVLLNGAFVGFHEGFFSPFEFDITEQLQNGENRLSVTVRNDYIYGGNDSDQGGNFEGDKMYAATGFGWDDPSSGWHHCPPGMGITGPVYIERRPLLALTDLYVRPLPDEGAAEICAEVTSKSYQGIELSFSYNIYARNFEDGLVAQGETAPTTGLTVGRGDSLTESALRSYLGKGVPLCAKHGVNVYKFRIPMENARRWSGDSPYLYEAQLTLHANGAVCDAASTVFGMRTFRQDTGGDPKGMFYLNGVPTRLRGANTMGFEQQDVLRGDMVQLVDDILLARLCHMNFLRITQRPVQKEVYDICDSLGMMVQTDLPLFGVMRRTRVPEGIRQAEEMERLIRPHACCVLVSYINEPFPNANNEPHRHLERPELERFFEACDIAVHLQNPDRVIKHIDGDYDPPSASMPDNHCYPMWYNGHGIDIGRLHRGEWLSVKPGWYYGCGEFGAEGLDSEQVMLRYYPKEWLTEPFDPGRIVRAQTGMFGGFFFDRQDSRAAWIAESQRYQAMATKLMTEAFRRDDRMATFAIHLFIDAWPSGWMKTIMDCDRIPKAAYFAYRDALRPVLLSLRTDRFTVFCGEEINVEAWLCNDTAKNGACTVRFLLRQGDSVVAGGDCAAELLANHAAYACECSFRAPAVQDRETYTVEAFLLDENGSVISDSRQNIEVFRHVEVVPDDSVVLHTCLAPGDYEIAGSTVHVKPCGMLPLHFVSRKTGSPRMASFRPDDFRLFYDRAADRITPLIENTFTADGFTPLLISCNQDEHGGWSPAYAAAERIGQDGKRHVVCNVDLRMENPVAERFMKAIYDTEPKT